MSIAEFGHTFWQCWWTRKLTVNMFLKRAEHFSFDYISPSIHVICIGCTAHLHWRTVVAFNANYHQLIFNDNHTIFSEIPKFTLPKSRIRSYFIPRFSSNKIVGISVAVSTLLLMFSYIPYRKIKIMHQSWGKSIKNWWKWMKYDGWVKLGCSLHFCTQIDENVERETTKISY